jgi:transposase
MKRALPLSVGIDVSKDTLAVSLRFPDHEEHLVVPNGQNGITALHRKLRLCPCFLIMESTGRYHVLAAFLLTEKGYDVRVVNPIQTKRYISASTRKKKTDKTDASALAQMGVTEQRLPERFALSKTDIQIRHKIGLLCSLEKQLQSQRHSLKEYAQFQEQMKMKESTAERRLMAAMETLTLYKEQMQEEIQALILQDAEKKQRQELACSIPGISAFLGSMLSQMLRADCTDAKQWIAFVGFDVSLRQSGRWRGRGKLSKRGSGYLRKKLFQASWGAVMHNEQFRRYYDDLRKKGHSYRATLVIIARKLLRILFIVLKKQQPFAADLCLFPA